MALFACCGNIMQHLRGQRDSALWPRSPAERELTKEGCCYQVFHDSVWLPHGVAYVHTQLSPVAQLVRLGDSLECGISA
jgi:hypothetical protein